MFNRILVNEYPSFQKHRCVSIYCLLKQKISLNYVYVCPYHLNDINLNKIAIFFGNHLDQYKVIQRF